jgi:NAD(P)H dehydrogenase (quinone)
MTALIVYAHPEPRSFTGALRDAAVRTLGEMGHEVLVSDLYAMRFNPVPGWHDFVDHDRAEFFGYEIEQKRAAEAGSFAPDLRAEMEKLLACDLLLLNFPLWWYGFPAILKGWVDRVFAAGFAYGGGRWFDRGVFRGKQAMLVLTTGGPESAYSPEGLQGDISQILFPIQHGVLHYTGFDVLPPFIAFGASYRSEEGKERLLGDFDDRLRKLETFASTPPPSVSDFDDEFRRR